MAPADRIQLPHHGVVFVKMKKPKLTLLFSAAWRKTGNLTGVEALVKLLKCRIQPDAPRHARLTGLR